MFKDKHCKYLVVVGMNAKCIQSSPMSCCPKINNDHVITPGCWYIGESIYNKMASIKEHSELKENVAEQ